MKEERIERYFHQPGHTNKFDFLLIKIIKQHRIILLQYSTKLTEQSDNGMTLELILYV
jgi:hypothetical protein